MGKLRVEPKDKPFLNEKDYKRYLGILKEARDAALDNHIYWDLEKGENPTRTRKAFIHVAEKESINVTVRKVRGSNSLNLIFEDKGKANIGRISADESRRRIMDALKTSADPMQKAEIINLTGISPSTWNIRIKELIKDGSVIRTGDRRETRYRLAS